MGVRLRARNVARFRVRWGR